jgi:hypothetical protein
MDAQCPHQLRIVEKVTVGAEPGRVNAGNRTQIIELIGIPGDPDGANEFAGPVAD